MTDYWYDRIRAGRLHGDRMMGDRGQGTTTATARLVHTIERPWTSLEPIRLGCVPVGHGTPERYLIVEFETGDRLRVDIYACEGCFAFEEMIQWNNILAVGFGSQCHLVDATTRTARSMTFDSYFAHLYPQDTCLLIASGERLRCIDVDGELWWTSPPLGIDGVIVHDVASGIISGEGEWDPLGGWSPFRLRLDSGMPP